MTIKEKEKNFIDKILKILEEEHEDRNSCSIEKCELSRCWFKRIRNEILGWYSDE